MLEKGHMGITQRQGVITLIPKKDKNPNYIKNWRPITLLNVDYKLLTKYVAQYLKTHLSELINVDQKGFLSSRYIGENINNATTIIEYCKIFKLEALLLFLDFQKAFDCVEWNLLHKAIKLAGFQKNVSMII